MVRRPRRPPGSRPPRSATAGSTSAGRPPPTTSASPATGSSAARAPAAPTSPRLGRPPRPATATPVWRPRPPTATRCARWMARGNLSPYSVIATATTPAGCRHDAPHGALRALGHRGQQQPDRFELDGLHRQHRRRRLPDRALPGRDLHHLRPGRHPHGGELQRHRPGALDHLPLPGARGGWRGEPESLLRDRHRDHPGGRRHDAAIGTHRALGHRGQQQPDRFELDGLHRQHRRRRLPGRALPGNQLHQLRPGGDAHRDHLQQHGTAGKHQLPLPGASRRRRGEPESLLRHRDRSDPRQRHHTTDRSDGARRGRGGTDGGQSRLDGLDRQRRGHRLPGRALPGHGLHQLRRDRHAHRDHLRRHRPVAVDHLPLPGPGGRRRRQPQHILQCRHGDHASRFGHLAADRPDGVDRDRRRVQPGGAELDGLDRQRRRRRLSGRALPGHGLHQLRPDRHAHRHHLQRHRRGALEHLPLPDPGGRCLRQPEWLFRRRRGHHRRRSAHPRGPGRGVVVRRGIRHHHRRCLRQWERRDLDRAPAGRPWAATATL